MSKPLLNIYLANPRGFCAGVDRAIQIVEQAIEKYGAPVYVRHEIVHNQYVVDELKKMGAIFIDELREMEDTSRPVVFSAHGVPKSVPNFAEQYKLFYIDATCPLVSKVHHETMHYAEQDYHILLIGHKNHPEVVGTMGQVEPDTISLVEDSDDARNIVIPHDKKIALVTQTTLSLDDTAEIRDILISRFPRIAVPKKEDICYATTNRQMAIKEIAKYTQGVLIVGSYNSSNSIRLAEVASKAGVSFVKLIKDETEIPMEEIGKIKNLGISAGASAPEILVQGIINRLRQTYDITENHIKIAEENIQFKLPRILA
ncbi:MAG: 4-hydroxy-3-methylbut-2-enyl diphosphate reductase [Alphaproteobacteria bacterium]|nr:4-hydroxy-3-methylbut-2-enyl diphosphate reductase [Alphaproteobacteria bacterium]